MAENILPDPLIGMLERLKLTALRDRFDRSPLLKSQTRQANWRRANIAKYTAHLAVQRALMSGTLQKQGCEVCGRNAVDAHHDRYDEPLNVRWLCRRHHVRLHHYGKDMFPIGPCPAEGHSATE